MERKNIQKENKFLLSPEQKIALMEAKVARAQEQIQVLAEHARLLEKARARR
jgi:hypothetical protein